MVAAEQGTHPQVHRRGMSEPVIIDANRLFSDLISGR